MSELSFTKHSNIFDDEFMPGKLQIYRHASPLTMLKEVPLQEISENVRSQENLTLSLSEAKGILPNSHLVSKHTCSTQADSQTFSYSQVCIGSMVSSIVYNPTPEANRGSGPWSSVNQRERELFERLIPIQEEERLLESSQVVDEEKGNNQIPSQEITFVSEPYETINNLSESIFVPPKTVDKLEIISSFDQNNDRGIEKFQQEDLHEYKGNSDNFQSAKESELPDQEKMLIEQEENDNIDYSETNLIPQTNVKNNSIEEKDQLLPIEFPKVITEEKGVCTEQIIPDVLEKGISCTPLVFDKGMCTEQTISDVLEKGTSCVPMVFAKGINTDPILIVEESEKSEKELENLKEDVITDSQQLNFHHEALEIESNFQEETIQELQELRILKHHYLSQLSYMKTKIKKMKDKQLQMKENVYNSMKQTLKSLSQFVNSNLNNYFLQRLKTQKENVLAYKIKVTKLKKELDDLKSIFVGATEKVKKEIANIIKDHTKKEISKIIERSIKETVQEPEILRKYTDLLDNYSITTNSSPTTPMKISAVSETPSTNKERKSSKRKHRRDPAMLEGMLYLLESGSLNNPFKEKEDFRKTFENFIKVNESGKLTDELILSSLIERTRRDEDKTLKQKSSVSKSDLIASTVNHKEIDFVTKDSLKSGKESITKKVKRS